MSNFIGPALPPHLLQAASNDEDCNTFVDIKSNECSDKGKVNSRLNLSSHILRAASEGTDSSDWERGPPQVLSAQMALSEMSEDSAEDTVRPISPAWYGQRTKIHLEEKCIVLPHELHINSEDENNINVFHESSLKSPHNRDNDLTMINPVIYLEESCEKEISQDRSVNVGVIGPELPSVLQSYYEPEESRKSSLIGPYLPLHLAERTDELPPSVQVSSDPLMKPIIGPCLPSPIKLGANLSLDNNEDSSHMYGPALPPGFCPKTIVSEPKQRIQNEHSSDTDDCEIGPLPEGTLFKSKVQQHLEIRAKLLHQSMANEKIETPEGPVRESWMLELPAHWAPELGLKSRQFRMREAPDASDRSVWTDTPADRERKKSAPKNTSTPQIALKRQTFEKREELMQKLVKQHGSKRGSLSLLQIHEEKLEAKRKKKVEAGEVSERRPFSREVDLQVNYFDETQKKSIIKKAQHLNDRFSAGESKFL